MTVQTSARTHSCLGRLWRDYFVKPVTVGSLSTPLTWSLWSQGGRVVQRFELPGLLFPNHGPPWPHEDPIHDIETTPDHGPGGLNVVYRVVTTRLGTGGFQKVFVSDNWLGWNMMFGSSRSLSIFVFWSRFSAEEVSNSLVVGRIYSFSHVLETVELFGLTET